MLFPGVKQVNSPDIEELREVEDLLLPEVDKPADPFRVFSDWGTPEWIQHTHPQAEMRHKLIRARVHQIMNGEPAFARYLLDAGAIVVVTCGRVFVHLDGAQTEIPSFSERMRLLDFTDETLQ